MDNEGSSGERPPPQPSTLAVRGSISVPPRRARHKMSPSPQAGPGRAGTPQGQPRPPPAGEVGGGHGSPEPPETCRRPSPGGRLAGWGGNAPPGRAAAMSRSCWKAAPPRPRRGRAGRGAVGGPLRERSAASLLASPRADPTSRWMKKRERIGTWFGGAKGPPGVQAASCKAARRWALPQALGTQGLEGSSFGRLVRGLAPLLCKTLPSRGHSFRSAPVSPLPFSPAYFSLCLMSSGKNPKSSSLKRMAATSCC